MVSIRRDNDKYSLGALDVRIMLALLVGPANGYQIARQCEADASNKQRVSNGVLYRALKLLSQHQFIETVSHMQLQGHASHIYRLTSRGREALAWHALKTEAMLKLIRERST